MFLLNKITSVTDNNTKKSPKALNISKCSAKKIEPTNTATTGSIEPNMEVMVDPAYLTAKTSVRSEINVANNPSERSIDFYKLLISNISETGIEFNSSEDAFFHNYFRDKIESMNPSYGYEFLNVSLKELDKSLENK